ncbi:MAG: Cu2+-exporting ATPase [Myxococcota bacterium]|jgi:Cu2+-exporting ATPase
MSAVSVHIGRCPHCDLAIEGDDAFCCHGCELAYALVHDAGLGNYYTRRDVAGLRPEKLTGAWEAVPTTVDDDANYSVTLQVDGLRCASCTWVVEHLLERTQGIVNVTVSYASGRTHVQFDPEQLTTRDVANVIASIGYAPRPVGETEPWDDTLLRLGVAAFCTANLMLLTVSLYAGWSDGMAVRFQTLFRWGSLALATPIALYSAAPFFHGAWRGLRVGRVGMDVPIALAVGVLYTHGITQTVIGADAYLDSLGMLTTLLLTGRLLEKRGRRAAANAASAIAASLPMTARRRTETGVEDVPVADLRVGDLVELGMGDEAPADGTVVSGSADVQMAIITGESAPIQVVIGSSVVAGAAILQGSLAVRVDRVGADTIAMRMADAVHDATDRPLPPHPTDRLAPWFTLVTVGVALFAGAVWTALSGLHQGIEVTVAVLVVACPCALGLSVPLAVASGLGAVARRGVVFRDGSRLLALASVRELFMDKTGTVTQGTPVVLHANDNVLRLAAGLERSSHHPIAKALLHEAAERGLPLPMIIDRVETPGVGVRGRYQDQALHLKSGGPGRVVLEENSISIGTIELGDRAHTDARGAIQQLRNAGVSVSLLSGDHAEVTQDMGAALGATQSFGGVTPEQKGAVIRSFRHNGPVAFVGDGLNDSEALAEADVGFAMHTGVTSAVLLSDAVVTTSALRPIVAAFAGARATQDAVRTNMRRAFTYNIIAVIAAAFGLINPLIAAILMPLSSAWMVWGALSVDRRITDLENTWTS